MPRGTTTIPVLPPTQGQVTNTPPWLLQGPATPRATNCVTRFGRLTQRPGQNPQLTTPIGTRIMGGFSFTTVAVTPITKQVVATLTKLYSLAGGVATDITGTTPLTGTADTPARFAFFPSSGSNFCLMVNGTNKPQQWDGVAATFSDVAGTPPIARDLCVVANYVVLGNLNAGGILSPSRLQLSAFNNVTSWPGGSVIDLTDTNDAIVACRTLTRTAAMIYKDTSEWLLTLQAGIFPFRLEQIAAWPGPAGPSAVVRVGQSHYYFGQDARLYQTDGMSVTPISGAIDQTLFGAVNSVNLDRIVGAYLKADHSIWWFYPSSGSTDIDSAVSYHLDTGAFYLHLIPWGATALWEGPDVGQITWNDLAAFTWNTVAAIYPTWNSFGGAQTPALYAGTAGGQVALFKYGLQDQTGIPMTWTTPLSALAGAKATTRVDAVESQFLQAAGLVTVGVAVSPAGAEPTLTYTTIGTHDTSLTSRQLMTVSTTTLEDRLVSLQYTTTATTTLQWQGGLIHAWSQEIQ